MVEGAGPIRFAYIPGAAEQNSVVAAASRKRLPAGASIELTAKPPGPIPVPGVVSIRSPVGGSVAR